MKLTAKDQRQKVFKIIFILLFPILAAAVQNVAAQEDEDIKPLNLTQVEAALTSKKAAAAVKNKLLIEGVNSRKITFLMNAENEKKLRGWGASSALVEAVRKNAMPALPMIQKNLKNLTKPIEIKNSLGMELVLIPAGEFLMGLAKDEKAATVYEGMRQHKVKINQDFYLGKFEVTQAQWKAVMQTNPSEFQTCGGDCPVENIKWNQAQAFIKKLNEKNDGYHYRLPSEAEWEYAARATATTAYYWGDDPQNKDWQFYAHWKEYLPAKVGSYLPNAFGLYDMSGNVWEMCEDVWQRDFTNFPDGGAANLEGQADRRVIKGGGWGQSYDELRISKRNDIFVFDANYTKGFRIAATPINAQIQLKTSVK